jgi:hypothetical protein
MREAIYVLCAVTSLACAVLLFRGYLRSRTRLLLWSGLCFVGLLINNVMLFIDKVVYPNVDVWVPQRSLVALAGLLMLLYGLVWDTE